MTDLTRDRISGMEVWGGNIATWSQIDVEGLRIWVYSKPYSSDASGGDVYYVASSKRDHRTRILLADVSGHGEEASPLADNLRTVLQHNFDLADNALLVESINNEFECTATGGRFATALIISWLADSQQLDVCSAGHPSPLIYRTATKKWKPLIEEACGQHDNRNLPIGVVGGQHFVSTQTDFQEGDMLLGVSDSLTESLSRDGRLLGVDGLAEIMNSLNESEPSARIPALLNAVRQLNPANLQSDDTTAILIRATARSGDTPSPAINTVQLSTD